MKFLVCLTILIASILSGCSTKLLPKDDFIDALADTVWAGEEREVVLTTGTGGWYFADALGAPRRSVYGFYIVEYKVFDDWELKGERSESLRESAEYAIVHPEYCIRHFTNGLEERIECLPGNDAIAISWKFNSATSTFFRLYSGVAVVSETTPETSPAGTRYLNKALEFDEKTLATGGMFKQRVEHERSVLIGEPGFSIYSTDKEYSLYSADKFSCIILASQETTGSAKQAFMLLKDLPRFRQLRRQQSEAALARFTFRCENREVEKAYAWARLMLRSMYFERNGQSRLFAGLPESPYMDSFHSALAGIGLILSDSSRSRSVRLFETILAIQKQPDDVEFPSRLPTSITSGAASYTSNTTAGALALTFDRVVSLSDEVPLGLPTKFLKAVDKSVGADLNSRYHVLGLMAGPGLFPTIGFPPRERYGALLETQALFAVVRTYLATHRDAKSVNFEVPESALIGISDWNYPYFPAYAVGLADKQYQIPLGIEAVMIRFRNRAWRWYDALLIPEVANETLITPQMVFNTPCDSTQSVVPFLALSWLEKRDKRIADKLLYSAEQNDLITNQGLRSLSPNDAGFQSSHVFVYDNLPINAGLSGDVLVWTSGILADIYTIGTHYDSTTALFNSLSASIMNDGVVGGLPECVNGIPADIGSNVGRNPIFASSLAEYIRILYDDILHIDTKRPTYPGVRIVAPPDWGQVEFSFEAVGAVITLKRLDKETWTAEQTGSADQIPLEVELWPEPDVRGYGSLKLNPKMFVKFKVIPTTVGRYTLAWDEYPREK